MNEQYKVSIRRCKQLPFGDFFGGFFVRDFVLTPRQQSFGGLMWNSFFRTALILSDRHAWRTLHSSWVHWLQWGANTLRKNRQWNVPNQQNSDAAVTHTSTTNLQLRNRATSRSSRTVALIAKVAPPLLRNNIFATTAELKGQKIKFVFKKGPETPIYVTPISPTPVYVLLFCCYSKILQNKISSPCSS